MDYMHDMLSVSGGISLRYEASCEEIKQKEAFSQTITWLLDWATGSQLVVSVLQFPSSASRKWVTVLQGVLLDCVTDANAEGVQMCVTMGLQTFLRDTRKKTISNWEKIAIYLHYVKIHSGLWVNTLNMAGIAGNGNCI